MEDFALDIIIGKGPSARSIRIDLPQFTLVGATTRAGQLTAPLRDRFGVILRLELYTAEAAEPRSSPRSAGILEHPMRSRDGALEIARRSPGARPESPTACSSGCGILPRCWATVSSPGKSPTRHCDRLEIDQLGLDAIDRRMLTTIIRNYGGGPVGLETLAAAIGEESVTHGRCL